MAGGYRTVAKPALNPISTLDSGDTGNATEINGPEVDLQGVTARRFRRARVSIIYRSTLATARQLAFTSNLQSATATGGTYSDLGSASTLTVDTTGTVNGVFEYERDLTTSSRNVRCQFTPTFQTSTGGTTTATGNTLLYGGIISLMDANRLPASG